MWSVKKNKSLGVERKENRIADSVVSYFPFVYYYIGPLSFLAYIFAILKIGGRLNGVDWALSLLIVFQFTVSLLLTGFFASIDIFRFHFGFFIFYLYFKYSYPEVNLSRLLYFLFLLVVAEYGLIAVLGVPAEMLPNYPDPELAHAHFSETNQRIYSFGANASVTSVLIVVILLSYNSRFRVWIYSFPIMMMISSGTGMIFWLVGLFSRAKIYYIVIFIVLMAGLYDYFGPSDHQIFYKTSFYYMELLYYNKIDRINLVSGNLSYIDFIFGSVGPKGGDFSALNFFLSHGLYGVLVLVVLTIENINKYNFLALSILFFSSFHYHIIFSFPGQLVLGYMLALSRGQYYGVYPMKKSC